MSLIDSIQFLEALLDPCLDQAQWKLLHGDRTELKISDGTSFKIYKRLVQKSQIISRTQRSLQSSHIVAIIPRTENVDAPSCSRLLCLSSLTSKGEEGSPLQIKIEKTSNNRAVGWQVTLSRLKALRYSTKPLIDPTGERVQEESEGGMPTQEDWVTVNESKLHVVTEQLTTMHLEVDTFQGDSVCHNRNRLGLTSHRFIRTNSAIAIQSVWTGQIACIKWPAGIQN